MIAINNETSIGQIVSNIPLAAQVFYKHGIDFCCGGKISLGKVCSEKSIEIEKVIDQIHSLKKIESDEPDVQKKSLQEIISYILKEFHDTWRDELPALEHLMNKVCKVHGNTHQELHNLKNEFNILVEDISLHLQKEEKILFPYIIDIEKCYEKQIAYGQSHCGSVQNPIRQMEYEHDTAGSVLKKMNDITNGYTLPQGACNSYRSLFAGLQKMEYNLFIHIHTENNILHPRAIELEKKLSQ